MASPSLKGQYQQLLKPLGKRQVISDIERGFQEEALRSAGGTLRCGLVVVAF